VSELPQHLETRRRHIRQQRQAERAVAVLEVITLGVLAIAAVCVLFPR
jgi:hypothetical protein